ncbi:MAG: Dickkopf N-terminal cysteine-rich domain-containing protein [Polyangiaceae bacterium]
MKNHILGCLAISLALVMGCAAEANTHASNTPQQPTCMADRECGASQSCQKEEGKVTGICMAAAAGSNTRKSTCVGNAECAVGQVCQKESGALSGTCIKP